MKTGSAVVIKDTEREMTVKSINRGVVTCYWYETPAPDKNEPWPRPVYREGKFYYHNLKEVRR